MEKTQVIQVKFENHGCKAFFKKYASKRENIEVRITEMIKREVATGMTKVKLATRDKLAGNSCYEFRLNLGGIGSARIAFTVNDGQARVYFVTSSVQKTTFEHALTQCLGLKN